MKVALMINTGRRTDLLKLTLLSVIKQSLSPDEILIANGSADSHTLEIVDSLCAKFGELGLKIKHIWQEQSSKRGAIRNRALAACESRYVIQIDGDVILHRHFAQEHVGFSTSEHFICGCRANLSEKKSAEILERNELPNEFSVSDFESARHSLYIPFLNFFFRGRARATHSEGIHSSNLSYWLKDAEAVNGYDESIEGDGDHDRDFVARLVKAGIKRRNLLFCALQYHLKELGRQTHRKPAAIDSSLF